MIRAGTNPSTGQPTFAFRDPLLLQLNQYESTANSFYHGMTISASKRFGSYSTFQAHYTFSKAIDDVTDFNYDANDQTNLRAERGLSSFDQRHRIVASGVFRTPAATNGRGSLLAKALANFMAAPSFTATGGRPFNLLTGFDNYGDRHAAHHRPFGAGRNIGRGPELAAFDLRISKLFRLPSSERVQLEVTAEVFNLFNRTNFKSVNNTVGNVRLEGLNLTDSATGTSTNEGHLIGRRDRLPTQPLGFTSAFDPRQFQFGMKLLF